MWSSRGMRDHFLTNSCKEKDQLTRHENGFHKI
jgi:hypothetical protein